MFARAWGAAPQQVGNLLSVVCVLALDRPAGLEQALVSGGMFGIGSLWALLLTLVIWRIYPFRPARRAVATVFRRLTVLAGDLASLLDQRGVTPAWEAHARAHRRYARDGIEDARTLVVTGIRSRGQSNAPGSALMIQIEAADQLFGAMIALSDVLEHGDEAVREAAKPALAALRLLLAATADAILSERSATDSERFASAYRAMHYQRT